MRQATCPASEAVSIAASGAIHDVSPWHACWIDQSVPDPCRVSDEQFRSLDIEPKAGKNQSPAGPR